MLITGVPAALAIKHGLGKTINNFPPQVEVSPEEMELISEEVIKNGKTAAESRKRHCEDRRERERLQAQVATLAAQVAALVAGKGEPPPPPGPDARFQPGAVWFIRYGDRFNHSKLVKGIDSIFTIEESDGDNLTTCHLGGRHATIKRETLMKDNRYCCIRPAGAARFTFPSNPKEE